MKDENKGKDDSTRKEPNQVQNPHDKFLKKTFEDREKAIATLEGILPPELFLKLDFETFIQEDTSYLDAKLKQFFSDIVFSCQTTDDIPLKITFLIEHKSYPPEFPHIQLLRYMLEIWERQIKEKKALNVILPILIYHGKESWAEHSFDHYFEGEIEGIVSKYIPLFEFLSANFQAISYQEINARFRLPSLKIAFRLMKSIRDENLPEKLSFIFDGLAELEKDELGRIYFETIIVYLLHGSKANVKEVMDSLYNISRDTGEFADSPAMQLIRQGREEALAEVQKEIQEASKQLEEAKKKAADARRKEAEAKKIANEAERKEAEAKKIADEAERKEAEAKKIADEAERNQLEAQQKIEIERKTAISKMLQAGVEKEMIANFLGLSLLKLANYIQQIENEKNQSEFKKEE